MNALTGEFRNKIALVTGAAQGMGFAIAERLGAAGARIALNDFNAEAAERAADSLRHKGMEAFGAPGNVAVSDDVRRIVTHVRRDCGRLDILVNNAGVLRPTRGELISDDEWDFVIDVNLKGTFLCCRETIPELRKSGSGRIVNVASTAGKSVSTIGGPHYTAAKAGVLGLTRHLARELARDGITVNAVCPGLIDTEMVRATIPEARVREYATSFPIPRLGQPAEIAELVAFLASERASYITGASLDINGGDLTI
jgi:NAD(P)-dependent dehydrogenase (short-subunit alcohol dehydrogenase family)